MSDSPGKRYRSLPNLAELDDAKLRGLAELLATELAEQVDDAGAADDGQQTHHDAGRDKRAPDTTTEEDPDAVHG